MAYRIRILPEHDLAYFRYSGTASIDDYLAVVDQYPRHPDFRLGQKNLVDLTRLEDIERDYARILELQARIAGFVQSTQNDIFSVIVAPSAIAQEASQIVLRSWEELNARVVRRMVRNMEEAAVLLGISPAALAPLFEED